MRNVAKLTVLTKAFSIALLGGALLTQVSSASAQSEEFLGTRAPLEDYQRETDRLGDLRDAPRDRPDGVEQQACPFTCNSQGYSHSGCREWREGDICFIAPKDAEGSSATTTR